MTTPLRTDFTDATMQHSVHPQHHNDLATVVNSLDTRVGTLESGVGRTTATYTTASLSAGGSEQGTITLAKSYRLLRIQTSAAARVRLYTTTANRTADLSRDTRTEPTAGSGVVLDYLTTASVGVSAPADLSPLVDGTSTATTPTSSIPITVTATGAGAITVTLTYIPVET